MVGAERCSESAEARAWWACETPWKLSEIFLHAPPPSVGELRPGALTTPLLGK